MKSFRDELSDWMKTGWRRFVLASFQRPTAVNSQRYSDNFGSLLRRVELYWPLYLPLCSTVKNVRLLIEPKLFHKVLSMKTM